jgi:DNA polymerase III subunit epsilon
MAEEATRQVDGSSRPIQFISMARPARLFCLRAENGVESGRFKSPPTSPVAGEGGTCLIGWHAHDPASSTSEDTVTSLAVLDVETTGLNKYRCDRIIEIAVVLLNPGTGITAEFATLLNPERDVGPTRIHGIAASDALRAPRFDQIAAELTNVFRKAATIAGHNVRFDLPFLRSEYERMGVSIPEFTPIDTMLLMGGGSLVSCCARHGIEFEGRAHAALYDARAVARLLDKILSGRPDLLDACERLAPIEWPVLRGDCTKLFPREKLQDLEPQLPGFVQRLAERLSPGLAQIPRSNAERDYRALLCRVLEDGRIEEIEGDSLVETAAGSGLTFAQVEVIHHDYLGQLARAAMADGIITDAERRELHLVARLLGFGRLSDLQVNDLLRTCCRQTEITIVPPTTSEWGGMTVCFTGECQCSIGGIPITRQAAERLAVEKGMTVMSSVTKKLNILVVADPDSQSGKAKKARQYGVRVMHEPVFWRGLGIPVD